MPWFKTRHQKRLGGGEGDDAGADESEEEDSDEEEYDFDDDEEEEVDDSCPPGCDISLYESVLGLRERRLDQEEILAEIQKTADELKRNLDRQVQNCEPVQKALAFAML